MKSGSVNELLEGGNILKLPKLNLSNSSSFKHSSTQAAKYPLNRVIDSQNTVVSTRASMGYKVTPCASSPSKRSSKKESSE